MTFYRLPVTCTNCQANTWHKDLEVELRTKGHRLRYSCVYCGNDIWPGGAIRPTPQEQREAELQRKEAFAAWEKDKLTLKKKLV